MRTSWANDLALLLFLPSVVLPPMPYDSFFSPVAVAVLSALVEVLKADYMDFGGDSFSNLNSMELNNYYIIQNKYAKLG